jgi:hypothetical protein
MKLKMLLVLSKATASSGIGWRLFEFEVHDFPPIQGLLLMQGLWGVAAAVRHRHSLIIFDDVGIQKGLCVIFVSGCKNLALI